MDQAVKASSNCRGRPRKRFIKEEELKERKKQMQETQRKYRRRMIGISSAYQAWNALKAKGHWSHGELAFHLLDVHSKFCTQANCDTSKKNRDHDAVSNEGVQSGEAHNPDERFEKSSDEIPPVPDPGAKILASYRPIRSKEELKASCVTGSDDGKNKITVPPEPGRNLNDASKSESGAASVSVDEVVAPQENITRTSEEGEQEKEEGWEEEGEITQAEVEMIEPTNVDDFLTFQVNLETDETGIKDGNVSDNEEHEDDSDCGAASDHELMIFIDADDEDRYSSEEGDSLPEKRLKLDHQVTDLPFKRFDVAEVAKAEGASGTESNKNKIKKLCWTEMERHYRCKICLFEDSNVYNTCRHVLQEHDEVADDLEDYLKERPASDSEPGRSLYDKVMAFPPSSDSTDVSNKGSESCDKIGEEMESVEIPEEGSEAIESKASDSDGTEKNNDPLDTIESVELLMRWVKLQISCQFCQQVFSYRLFTQKGERTVHKCRSIKQIPALCDVCGKSLAYGSFKKHWTETHCKPEETVCPYCGKMVRVAGLTPHILSCHTSSQDDYPCGICRKGFRNKKLRDKHEVIHQKKKPFKCIYCHRGFTQSSNMKHHMRQHTGEKPYQCDKCSESFAHNVSLKNHLKSKHGIDPWKMGAAGD